MNNHPNDSSKLIEDLKQLALAATPGPWKHRRHPHRAEGFVEAPQANGMAYALEILGDDYNGYGDEDQRQNDCAFIAAANPAAILQLIAALELREPQSAPADMGRFEILLAALLEAHEDNVRFKHLPSDIDREQAYKAFCAAQEALRTYFQQATATREQQGTIPVLPPELMAAFLRFCETTEDDESYDIEAHMVEQLAAWGAIRRRGTTAVYEVTKLGELLRAQPQAAQPPSDASEQTNNPTIKESLTDQACPYCHGTCKEFEGFSCRVCAPLYTQTDKP